MGTRGAIGFRFNGQDKVTYNHFDSYPEALGKVMVETVKCFDDEQLAGTANRIQLVDESERPSATQIKRYQRFANTDVSTGEISEWYVLLREVQGSLEPYITGQVDHMIDSHDFLADSLFCEWAYIINCDTRTLEVYEGFNEDRNAAGRYAASEPESKYAGVALIREWPFDVARKSCTQKLVYDMRAG